ncbi:MAG: biotin/lipoyl-binding protein [Clostridiales bacterium]|nr:biotin/lipoyl-binding protein [Clostridiales bacterium]
MMKKITAAAAALMLCVMSQPMLSAGAETVDGLILAATVQAKNEIVLTAPASGELDTFSVNQGDQFASGDTLFTVKPVKVYADIDGTVAGVYIEKGDIADAATARYGAAMQIEYTERYQITANTRSSYNNAECRNPYVGTQVYLRSLNEKHYADGVITAVSGQTFTVQIFGGDLVFTQDVNIYSAPEYESKSLLGRSTISIVEPYVVSASGTVTQVAVKKGDEVKAGDLLFAYVPDKLDPAIRGTANWANVKAKQDIVIKAVNVQQGASVQKDQILVSAYALGDYELIASVEESDVSRLQVGDLMTISFEELGVSDIEGTVARIGAIGSDGDVSKYTVALDFEVPEGVLIGMHATIIGK